MSRKKIETIVNEKIAPHFLNEKGKADISQLTRKYDYNLLLECIDIGIATYFRYDTNGQVTKESAENFIKKLEGIAYNKSRSPIDQEVYHLKNKCKKLYTYWNSNKADEIFDKYIAALKDAGYNDDQVVYDLQTEVNRLCNYSGNWSEGSDRMINWIDDIKHWNIKDDIGIEQSGAVLPIMLFDGLSSNFQRLCEQINASYENNLYDCAAVMMRRLLEGLLVLSYQNFEIESEITAKDGIHHLMLDKIIKNAGNNQTLKLSANVKKELALFKDLGNYSAHKIWYNCTKQDIEPHILKYRIIIEELLYKSGLRK